MPKQDTKNINKKRPLFRTGTRPVRSFYNNICYLLDSRKAGSVDKVRAKPAPAELRTGFVLLMVLIIVSITLVVSLGAANVIIGQVGISGIARDSKKAFFAAHAGAECAIYGDIVEDAFSTSTARSLVCVPEANSPFLVGGGGTSSFTINFPDGSCAEVVVTKPGPLATITNIKSRGHDRCPVNSLTVERGLEVDLNL